MDTLKKLLLGIAVAAIVYAVIPLFGRNYIPTHDGEYHIIRIVEFARMLGAGYLVPRWAPDMNSGYGIPIFNYHYPLPNYIGSLIHVFTQDAVYAFQMSQGLGYIALAIAAYLWLAALFGGVPALVGAVVTAFVPYLFVDIYVRGSIGEVWATVFLFFALFTLEKKKYVWFAVSYGLLILSHNIMAMIYTPFLLGYVLIRDKKALFWMLRSVGISAFFWLPALMESKYVVGLNTVNFREHFVELYQLLVPSWGTEFSGSGALGSVMSVQIGIVPLLVIFGALIAWRKHAQLKAGNVLLYFILVLGICILLMFPVSQPIWEIVKPLQLMQYSWRLLSFVIPVSGFCAAFWVSTMKNKWWGIVIAALAVLLAASYARPVQYAPRNEAYYMSRPNFTDGTSSMGNSFSTIWTGWMSASTTESGTLRLNQLNPETRVAMASEGALMIHTLYFPGWKAYIDGKEVPIRNEKGIIQVSVPAGEHRLRLKFTETPVRTIADIISIASVISLFIL